MNSNVGEIILFDGTKEATFSEIIGVYRIAVKDGLSAVDEYSVPFGPFAIRKGPYVFYAASREKFGFAKVNDDEETIEYVEFTEEEYDRLDDIVKNGRRF
jgi:hypothetical protein